jgi:hypothetical protein
MRKQKPTHIGPSAGGYDAYLGVRPVFVGSRRRYALKWVSCDGTLTKPAGVRQPFPSKGQAVSFGLKHFWRRAVSIPASGRAPHTVCDINAPLGRARHRSRR